MQNDIRFELKIFQPTTARFTLSNSIEIESEKYVILTVGRDHRKQKTKVIPCSVGVTSWLEISCNKDFQIIRLVVSKVTSILF